MGLQGFNLLQSPEEPPDLWDKIYDWVLNVGRVIVIVVELVVVISFGARIVIDTQAKELQERLQQNQATLSTFRSSESKYRNQQNKFNAYRTANNNAIVSSPVLSEILNLVPSGLTEFNYSMTPTGISIRGIGQNSEIQRLESSLRASDLLSEVVVSQLQAEQIQQQGLSRSEFSIQAQIDEQALGTREQIDPNNTEF